LEIFDLAAILTNPLAQRTFRSLNYPMVAALHDGGKFHRLQGHLLSHHHFTSSWLHPVLKLNILLQADLIDSERLMSTIFKVNFEQILNFYQIKNCIAWRRDRH
tara:strand:- start:372 stop:683 length:312 start_codon:yes stop_codon:yes gene_type:complete